MKKRLQVLLIVLSALLLFSCEKNTPIIAEITFNEETYLTTTMTSKGEEITVNFTTTVPWSASVKSSSTKTKSVNSWCTISPPSGGAGIAKIAIKVEANDALDDRECLVVIVSGDKSQPITVLQKGNVEGTINIEDANFKAYLIANFDTNDDNEISHKEALAVTEIKMGGKKFYDHTYDTDNIESLQGLEFFVNLKNLYCNGTNEWSDSGDEDKYLWIGNGKLATLDISKNLALEKLHCSYNKLTTLDISKNLALTELMCTANQLTTLDVTKNTALIRLDLGDNKLTYIDVTKNTALIGLGFAHNELTSIDITKNVDLISLGCTSNKLSTLDITKNDALKLLYCERNRITALDLTNATSLVDLDCQDNQITTLNLPENTTLTRLNCSSNSLTKLDITKNTALISLYCNRGNQLTNLDVRKNIALEVLVCEDNKLTTLDVSKNIALTRLYCPRNKLTTLDVSKNIALIHLDCGGNDLTSLNVTKNTALKELRCSGNPNLTTIWLWKGFNEDNTEVNRDAHTSFGGKSVIVALRNFQIYDRNIGAVQGGTALNYNNDKDHQDHINSDFRGGFYNWNDANRACPNGWRLPNNDEWEIICNAMKFSDRTAYVMDESGNRCYFPLSSTSEISSGIRTHYWSRTDFGLLEGPQWEDPYAYVATIDYNSATPPLTSVNKNNKKIARCIR